MQRFLRYETNDCHCFNYTNNTNNVEVFYVSKVNVSDLKKNNIDDDTDSTDNVNFIV